MVSIYSDQARLDSFSPAAPIFGMFLIRRSSGPADLGLETASRHGHKYLTPPLELTVQAPALLMLAAFLL